MQVWRERTFRATVVLLVASVVLIAPGGAGIDVSWPFLGSLGVLAAVFALARPVLGKLPTVADQNLGTYARDLWLAPLVGVVVVVVVAPDASAVELQALGGLVGLVGMVNYFLRPVYILVYNLVHRLVSTDSAASGVNETTDAPAVDDRTSFDSRREPIQSTPEKRPGDQQRTDQSASRSADKGDAPHGTDGSDTPPVTDGSDTPPVAGGQDTSPVSDESHAAGDGDSPRSTGNQG